MLTNSNFAIDGVHCRALYVTNDDSLRLRVFNSAAGVRVAIDGRLADTEGSVVPFSDRITPTADRLVSTKLVRLTGGWLLNLAVRADAGTPRRGQTFVVVELVRGFTGDVVPIGAIVQGYVTETGRRAWPGSPLEDSTDGHGVLRSITVADPAAGAEWSQTVPTNARWLLHSVRGTLTTDITVANRVPIIIIDDGANELARTPAHVVQAASLVRPYTFTKLGAGIDQGASGVASPAPFPFSLASGYRVRSLTTAIAGGDDWSVPQLLAEEWIEV